MAYTPKKFSALDKATMPLTGNEKIVCVGERIDVKDMTDFFLHKAPVVPTASYTVVLADAERLVRVNAAGVNTVTIPPNATTAFKIGTLIRIEQTGAGVTTIAADAGVTIRCARTLALRAQYAVAIIIKVAADEWVLSGDLT